MTDYLLFRIFGPMVAWGDVAVGERRHVFAQPTRSAVIGIVGAALGIRREEDGALEALHGGYGFATRLDAPGLLLTDFHTAQVPPASATRKAGGFLTRREELALRRHELETVLSYRDYHVDAYAIACLWAMPGAPHSLQHLLDALRRPRFAPYLGRRSCTPSLPFAPVIVKADGPVAALRAAAFPDDDVLPVASTRQRSYFWEGEDSDTPSMQTFVRRDLARSRVQWQFADRTEHHLAEEVPDVSEQD